MDYKVIKNDLLNHEYYEIDHKSGLKIFVYPKEGYGSTYAVFGTNYGSIDAVDIPNGTAHFLEHKLFESEELDAFQRFAVTGASANAYTSFDKTCYLFSCGANFKDNLEILLDFVQHPYFTEETVKKEQGIIGQEIEMYQDEPSWEVIFNLLRAAYNTHPVRIDIAGTVDSIAQISADMLYDCYNKYYNLSNMVLCCVGNTTVEEVLSVVDEQIIEKPCASVTRGDFGEKYEINEPYIEEKLSVSIPQFAIGFKLKPGVQSGKEYLKDYILSNIILDSCFGETTEFYNKLLDEGYVNNNCTGETFFGPGYEMIIISGESKKPAYVAEEIKIELGRLLREGIDEENFERTRRSHFGRNVMKYNDVDGLANDMLSSYFDGYRLFDEFEIYKNITVDDANKYLRDTIDVNNSALSVILPKE